MLKKYVSIRSKRKIKYTERDFKLNPRPLLPFMGPEFGPAETVRVKEGTILYVQCYNHDRNRPYGLILGFVASRWHKKNGLRTVTVNPLTTAGEKKYTQKLSKLLEGALNFW